MTDRPPLSPREGYDDRRALARRLDALARRFGWHVWVRPATAVGDHWEVHTRGSYWTTVGLRPWSAQRGGNLAYALWYARNWMARSDLR